MEFNLSFNSEKLDFQEPSNSSLAENIAKNLSKILGMKVEMRHLSSRLMKAENKVHFVIECYGELDDLLKAIDGKIEHVKEFGIEDIELWCHYAYEGQCNFDFTPMQLLKMGKNRLPLLISCWEKQID
jgi:DNA-binding transcriptional regulator WhiA